MPRDMVPLADVCINIDILGVAMEKKPGKLLRFKKERSQS